MLDKATSFDSIDYFNWKDSRLGVYLKSKFWVLIYTESDLIELFDEELISEANISAAIDMFFSLLTDEDLRITNLERDLIRNYLPNILFKRISSHKLIDFLDHKNNYKYWNEIIGIFNTFVRNIYEYYPTLEGLNDKYRDIVYSLSYFQAPLERGVISELIQRHRERNISQYENINIECLLENRSEYEAYDLLAELFGDLIWSLIIRYRYFDG